MNWISAERSRTGGERAACKVIAIDRDVRWHGSASVPELPYPLFNLEKQGVRKLNESRDRSGRMPGAKQPQGESRMPSKAHPKVAKAIQPVSPPNSTGFSSTMFSTDAKQDPAIVQQHNGRAYSLLAGRKRWRRLQSPQLQERLGATWLGNCRIVRYRQQLSRSFLLADSSRCMFPKFEQFAKGLLQSHSDEVMRVSMLM